MFSDSMVLQRERKIPVSGKALPGSAVTVIFANQHLQTVADSTGSWEVTLEKLEASSIPEKLTVISNNEKIVISDILVGEVWHVSGQSNMELSGTGKLREYNERKEFFGELADVYRKNIAENIASMKRDDIRFITVRETKNSWQKCVGEETLDCPLVPLFFACRVNSEINIPIGIVNTSYGCASLETYMTPDTLEKSGFLELAEEGREFCVLQSNGGIDALEESERNKILLTHCRHPRYRFCRSFADDKGNVDPDRIPLIKWHMSVVKTGGAFYSTMNKVLKFPVRGMLWYQGCTNLLDKDYARMQKLFVESMREFYNDDKMPFYFVMIAPHPFGPEVLPQFYLQQYEAAVNTPYSFLVATADTPPVEQQDYHPSTKDFIGERLALAALKNTYGKNFPDSGPIFDNAVQKENSLVVSFRHADDLHTIDGEAPKLFEIASADGKFFPADAEIADDKIILSSKGVVSPVYARYCWTDIHTGANTVNGAGFTVFPFDSSKEFFTSGKCRDLKF